MSDHNWIIIGSASALFLAKATILVLHYRLRMKVYKQGTAPADGGKA